MSQGEGAGSGIGFFRQGDGVEYLTGLSGVEEFGAAVGGVGGAGESGDVAGSVPVPVAAGVCWLRAPASGGCCVLLRAQGR